MLGCHSRRMIATLGWVFVAVGRVWADPTAGLVAPGTNAYPNGGQRLIGQPLILTTTDNKGLYSATYDPVHGYGYFASSGTTLTKVDLNGLYPVEIGSAVSSNGGQVSGFIDPVGGFAYLAGSGGKIDKFSLGASNSPPSYLGSLSLNSDEKTVLGSLGDLVHGYGYFSCAIATAKIVKVALGVGTNLPARVGTLTLNPGEDGLRRGIIDPVNGYAWFASAGIVPTPVIVKVALGTGTNLPSRIAAIPVDPQDSNIGVALADLANGYGYFGSYNATARVYKVSLGTGTNLPVRVGVTTLPIGERELCSGVIDLGAGYLHLSDDHTYPGKVYKISVGAGTNLPVQTGLLPLLSGTATNPADGVNVINQPNIPTNNWGEVFLQSAIIDTNNGYAYLGCDSHPGMVVKVALNQQSAIKGTKFILSATASVASVSFYSHAAAGHVRLGLYDNGVPKKLLWQSAELTNTAANAYLTVPTGLLWLPPGTYWLAWQVDTTANVPSYTAGLATDGILYESRYGAFPGTISGDQTNAERWTQFITYNTPIESWRLANFGPDLTNALRGADLADPDGDGLVNLAEYAFGTNPNTDSGSQLSSSSGGITFTRNPAATDIDFTIEATSDLTNTIWSPIATKSGPSGWITNPGVTVTDAGTGPVSVVESGPFTNRFWRVRIDGP